MCFRRDVLNDMVSLFRKRYNMSIFINLSFQLRFTKNVVSNEYAAVYFQIFAILNLNAHIY